MKMDYKLEGFAETDRFFQEAPKRVRSRILQAIVNSGASVIRKRVRAEAPKSSGDQSPASKRYGSLRSNINNRVWRGLSNPNVKGVSVNTGNAFWGYILQYGSRYITGTGWFSKAVEKAVPQAVATMESRARVRVNAEMLKLSKEVGSNKL